MSAADNVVRAMGMRAAPADAGDPAAPTNEQQPTKPAPAPTAGAGSDTPLTDAMVKQQAIHALYGTLPGLTSDYNTALARASADPLGYPPNPDGTPNTSGPNNTAIANNYQTQISDTLKELQTSGYGPGGAPMTAAESAAIGATYARLAVDKAHYDNQDATAARNADEAARSNKANEGLQADRDAETAKRDKATADAEAARNAETQRNNNISATLDLLQKQIARGDLTATEARDKATAAFNSANVQRGIIADNAGRVVPQGSQYMPALGPNDVIAHMAGALGLPFSPVASGGTYQVDPNAIAAPITAAQQGSAVPQVNQAMQNAAAALAGLRVPVGAAA